MTPVEAHQKHNTTAVWANTFIKAHKSRKYPDLDVGDIVGVSGVIMKTKKGELSIYISNLSLLTKSLRNFRFSKRISQNINNVKTNWINTLKLKFNKKDNTSSISSKSENIKNSLVFDFTV